MESLLRKYLDTTLGKIIYAGVGHSEAVDYLHLLNYEQLHFIEPITSIADKLQKKYASENVIITNSAISSETGSASFTVMEPAKYSSLVSEVKLSQILKNSRVKNTATINTLSLSDLIHEMNLDADTQNVLILSINGAERECLESINMDDLTPFSLLFVQIEMKGVFTRGSSVDIELKALLKSKGFYFEEAKQGAGIYTNLVFKRDDATVEWVIDLQRQLRIAKNETRQVKEEKAQLSSEKEELKLELAEALEECTKKEEALNIERESIKEELKEVKRSANLGQKMLAKSQIDLDHLRESYAKKVESEQELVNLVKELKGKLTLASKYYFQLQKEHPELLSSTNHVEDI